MVASAAPNDLTLFNFLLGKVLATIPTHQRSGLALPRHATRLFLRLPQPCAGRQAHKLQESLRKEVASREAALEAKALECECLQDQLRAAKESLSKQTARAAEAVSERDGARQELRTAKAALEVRRCASLRAVATAGCSVHLELLNASAL